MAKKKKSKVARKSSSSSHKVARKKKALRPRSITRLKTIADKPGWMGIEALHLAFTSKDPHAIANFYRDTLGFVDAGPHRPGARLRPGYARSEESRGLLQLKCTRDSGIEFQNYDVAYHWVAQLGGRPPEEPLTAQIFLLVKDVDRVYERLSKKGVQFFGPPRDMPWGVRIVECFDPEGRRVVFAEGLKKG
jgi:uncharacterized glyoxalase superfamily protein PhnB